MAGHWEDWFEREELIGQISDLRVQNLQVEREVVQKRTFTRWMNLHLEKCDPPLQVGDLFQDIQDGRILMALLEELSGCRLLHGFKKSSHRIFRLNNIAKVLSFLEERNVKLVSIDAADVADGNSSIILGLIWNIILFFQIKELTGNIRSQFPSSCSLSSIPTDADASFCTVSPSDGRSTATKTNANTAVTPSREQSKAIRKLLQWVQKKTRRYSVSVRDFGPSWTSGLAFLALIKSIDSGLVDMRKALLRSAKDNLEDAFRTAHYSLGIPRLLEPEDVTMNSPDEQSIMMYVSQFLEHFPGVEEPEESFHQIERSVSMGRLNHRHFDSDLLKNGSYRGRVKERSHIFQRDGGAKPPPKILISSVSEDRGVSSPASRAAAAARSWSSEDLLADSPYVDETPKNTKKPVSEALSDSAHSPTGSSAPESSAVGDSAISSPDSWVEGEAGSPLDSGTSWDVYRATPVEVTAVDEGFVPSAEDSIPDQPSIAESFVDEGIYSLSSLEINQTKVPDNQDQNKDFREEEEGKLLDQNQDLSGQQEANQEKSERTNSAQNSSKNEGNIDKDCVEQEANLKRSETLEMKDSDLNSSGKKGDHDKHQGGKQKANPMSSDRTETPDSVLIQFAKEGENLTKDQAGEPALKRSETTETKDSDLELTEKLGNNNKDLVSEQNSDLRKSDTLDLKQSDIDKDGGIIVKHNKDQVGRQDSDLRSSDATETKDSVLVQLENDKQRNHDKDLIGEQEGKSSEATKTEDSDLKQSENNRERRSLGGEVALKRSDTTDVEDSVSSQPDQGKVPKEGELPFGSCVAELPPSSSEDQILTAEDRLEMNHNTKLKSSPDSIHDGLEQNYEVTEVEKSSRELGRDDVDQGQDQQEQEDQVKGQSLYKGANEEESPEYTSGDRTKSSRNESESLNNSTEVHQELKEEPSTSCKEFIKDKNSEHLTISDQKESRTNLVIPLISISCGSQEVVEEEPEEEPTDGSTPEDDATNSDPFKNRPNVPSILISEETSDIENDYLEDEHDTVRSLNPTKGKVMIDTIEEEEEEEEEEARGRSPSLPEPMDLFYPDKEEEPLLTDPLDEEMQSWPSVLSVSALQPAPSSSHDLPPTSRDQDFLSQSDDVILEEEPKKQVTPDSDSQNQNQDRDQNQDQDQEQEQSWLVPISVSPAAPVLRQRKGCRLSGPSDNPSGSARNAHKDNSEIWASEQLQLSLLLCLWLLLYCFWVLPQMDLKMLLNH